MANKKEETASFVLRLSQKIFDSEEGDAHIQWRGNIRHIQTGDETRFTTFEEAQTFVQQRLTTLTMKAIEDKPEDEQKGIIYKSLDFWKKMANATPKIVLDSIKDPKKQAAYIQEQVQEQIHQFSDAIGQKFEETIGSKIELDNIFHSSKSELKDIVSILHQMSQKIDSLTEQVDALSAKKKTK